MMIAVMADIHSNFEAFRTCINETEKRGIEDYIFLGDYLGDLAYPQKTLGLLKKLRQKYRCVFIRGNKEEYWINHRKNKDEVWKDNRSGTGMLCYNYENISDGDIDFFEDMPISKVIRYEGYPEFTVCHGSPFKVNQSMRPDYDYIDGLTKELTTEMTICGHFHIQTDYTRNGKRVINPGSVGVPIHSPGKAQFMILNGHNGIWDTELMSVEYDMEQTIREMEEERLYERAPCWFEAAKRTLRTGKNSFIPMLETASEFYLKATGIRVWQDIPEEYWNMALAELDK
ncbi:MAG: metallophosphoesterase [Ruminococcaceae bacterium]|nr:metallophosphoesterase [Oscillospiraceae bacterium]